MSEYINLFMIHILVRIKYYYRLPFLPLTLWEVESHLWGQGDGSVGRGAYHINLWAEFNPQGPYKMPDVVVSICNPSTPTVETRESLEAHGPCSLGNDAQTQVGQLAWGTMHRGRPKIDLQQGGRWELNPEGCSQISTVYSSSTELQSKFSHDMGTNWLPNTQ